jgi:hypothetical protein
MKGWIDMSDYIYTYDKDELREYLEKISKGIRVLMTPELEADLKMYAMELESEVMDNEDDMEAFKQSHSELMKKKLEQKKREATKEDVLVIQLSDDVKRQLKEDMSESIVRDNPNLIYHKRDDELYTSEEKKQIFKKLSRLQKCYYNQQDYVNAIKIIFEAIEYSLKHDYPWMSYEDALQEFNAGKIRFEYCQLPKLYLNWTTVVEDPETLKGVINGTITIVQKDEETKKKKREEPVPVRVEVDVTGADEWNYWYDLHRKGYNTPISPVIKASQGTFSRFALPQTNMFYQQKEQMQRTPQEFDWMQDNAGQKYYELISGKKYTTSDLLDDLQTANNGNLTARLQSSIDTFLDGLKHVDYSNGQQAQQLYQSNLVKTPDRQVLEMEQSILQAMKNSNPNK